MSEEMIVRHCSPTLAGLKTGNLFLCAFQRKGELYGQIKKYNMELNRKGIMLVLLRIRGKKGMIYMFRPRALRRVLMDRKVRNFLEKHGYGGLSMGECLKVLAEKMKSEEEFPHEIGIFLGYPVGDVEGYMEKKGKEAIFGGHWKVYSDMEEAEKAFRSYRKCTNIYCKKYAEGTPLQKLVVDQRQGKKRKEII